MSRALAAAIGARVLEIQAGAKARYHAAAVIASNFPIVLLAIATRVLTSACVSDEAARGALGTLLAAAAENVRALSPSGRSRDRWRASTSRRCARTSRRWRIRRAYSSCTRRSRARRCRWRGCRN